MRSVDDFLFLKQSLKLGPGMGRSCWFTSIALIIKLTFIGLVYKKYNILVRLQFVKLFSSISISIFEIQEKMLLIGFSNGAL